MVEASEIVLKYAELGGETLFDWWETHIAQARVFRSIVHIYNKNIVVSGRDVCVRQRYYGQSYADSLCCVNVSLCYDLAAGTLYSRRLPVAVEGYICWKYKELGETTTAGLRPSADGGVRLVSYLGIILFPIDSTDSNIWVLSIFRFLVYVCIYARAGLET